MREYRGKAIYKELTIKKGDWVYGYLSNEESISWYDKDKDEYMCAIIDPGTVGQFTGLLDKNGKKIFEGDILNYGSEINDIIKYEKEDWCEDGFHTGYLLFLTADQYEIIGNIYDNPELIEEDNE
jgi:uncharacterized phage protein (TIGR01671 family)